MRHEQGKSTTVGRSGPLARRPIFRSIVSRPGSVSRFGHGEQEWKEEEERLEEASSIRTIYEHRDGRLFPFNETLLKRRS